MQCSQLNMEFKLRLQHQAAEQTVKLFEHDELIVITVPGECCAWNQPGVIAQTLLKNV